MIASNSGTWPCRSPPPSCSLGGKPCCPRPLPTRDQERALTNPSPEPDLTALDSPCWALHKGIYPRGQSRPRHSCGVQVRARRRILRAFCARRTDDVGRYFNTSESPTPPESHPVTAVDQQLTRLDSVDLHRLAASHGHLGGRRWDEQASPHLNLELRRRPDCYF